MDDIQQLEFQLTKAVSYEERSLIRTKLRLLKKEKNSVKSVALNSLPVQTNDDLTQRPRSAIFPNGYGSNASVPLENGDNRQAMTESFSPSRVTSSKSTHFTRDSSSYNSSSTNGDSHASKRHSYQPTLAAKGKVIASKTPPVRRKEIHDKEESRARSKTLDPSLGNDTGPEAITIQTLTKQQIQFCLTEYVNRELKPNRKILPTGESLYLVCADPRILCRLVNVSKKNTIDMRCVTEISDTASDAQIKMAVEENMTLAVESARSIGCYIKEEEVLKIIHHDADTIHKVLIKILQARVIDFGGMEDLPSSYFSEPSFLFEQLNIPIPSASNVTVPAADTTQSSSGHLTPNNDTKPTDLKKSGKSAMTSSQENLSRNPGTGVAVRRIYSDLPPDVKERPQITKGKRSSDIKDLAASFEKPRIETVTRQTSDSPKKLEPLQTEFKSSPSNLRRNKDTFTKTYDSSSSSKPAPLVVEEQKKLSTERTTLPTVAVSSKSAPVLEEKKVPSENKSVPVASVEASSEVHKSPSRSPNKFSSQVATQSPYRSPRNAKKSDSHDDVPDSVFVPKQKKSGQPTQSAVTDPKPSEPTPIPEPVSAPIRKPTPPQEPSPVRTTPSEEPAPKLTVDIATLTPESPNDSPATSTSSTPIASIDSTKDSDDYLLTLQDTDPSLTYEQRKRIRQLKRIRKQNQTKK